MKFLVSIFFLNLFLGFSFISPVPVDYMPLELAMKSANAKNVSKFFDKQIELTIQGGEFNIQNSYSKSQAQSILANFFEKNEVNDFETKHSGSSSWSKYIIGYLTTEQGKYRSLIRYLNTKGELTIQELELTLEDE
ncbi:MAG: DUF4783 domain-containing protein [Bacteroidia bacterium]